jgi:HSP20 family molecular chaperone IbpA
MSNVIAMQKSNGQSSPAESEQRQAVWYTPRVDILESDEGLTIFADLPGVRPDDVHLRFENGELSIHGRCQQRHKGVQFVSQEYGVGDFSRAFTVGETIDSSRISAEMKNGVLAIQLPKSEAVKPRRIQVKA